MTNASAIFEYQISHWGALAVLLAAIFLGVGRLPEIWRGEFLGISTRSWALAALANAVIHQFFVWLCWRTELHGKILTRLLGDRAFPVYAVIFTILIIARPILITAVAFSNAGAMPGFESARHVLGAILVVPSAYLLYSVKKYFGFQRALGIDHFDPSYRSAGLVREGIFRYSSNSMYIFGFMMLWIPGIVLGSVAAIALAAFSHLYIWVHYFFTEKPDMANIYGAKGAHSRRA